MQPHRRREKILRMVRGRGDCTIAELAEALEVSDETIRRTIRPLIADGLVEKVHGGIVLNEQSGREPPFQRRMQEHVHEKSTIAELAASVVQNGDSVILDTGSTNTYVARALRRHDKLSVVTNCTEIARTLAPVGGNRVHIAGGELRADDSAVFGPSSIEFVRQFQVRYAILSIGAITENGEFMDFHLEEAEFSRAVIAQAQCAMVVADHSKFGSRAFVRICNADQIDVLVCDRRPNPPLAARLEEAGISIVTP
ncbi:MAG: DeoR/GlpR transcriptional regulator [Proteobacteria bacterium]|nr:MAG: DeoR/GlpR transcriptional regulator [Pseudomonadota bacterium]